MNFQNGTIMSGFCKSGHVFIKNIHNFVLMCLNPIAKFFAANHIRLHTMEYRTVLRIIMLDGFRLGLGSMLVFM